MSINIYDSFRKPAIGDVIVSFTPTGVGDTDNVEDSITYTLYVIGRYDSSPEEIEDFLSPFADSLISLSESEAGNPCQLVVSEIHKTTEYTTNDVYDGQIVNLIYQVYNITIQASQGNFSDPDNANDIWINGEKVKPLTSGNWIDVIYPVGTYYHTSDTDFDPNEHWSGTDWNDVSSSWSTPGSVWERIS